jgi:hypothetical protein
MPGSTPVFGFPYPDPSDLVANYPALGQQLAEDVEAEFLLRGKILQVVRATDATQRSTTSTTYVDANISVTITPQKNDSFIFLMWYFSTAHLTTSNYGMFQITDVSNNAISGSENGFYGSNTTTDFYAQISMAAYHAPATLSATTYKGRFKVSTTGTNFLNNNVNTGQLFAIEVAA